MRKSIARAIKNVVAFGDTDIFPFPLDNVALRENPGDAAKLCWQLHTSIEDSLTNNPPTFYDSLVPNGYTGFRWATQIDTFWNAYFLSLVINLGPKIESARLAKNLGIVHSYRFLESDDPELWDRKFGWNSYYEKTKELAENHKYIVVCDVSEFYKRIYHHRLENALKQISKGDMPSRIMKILSAFSRGTSYGLPIGGPAARLLSELVLNQIDHLLHNNGFSFCRFADDYVIAADTLNDAYLALVFITEKLQMNQGLTLQKAKTRILTSAEYRASQPLIADDDGDETDIIVQEKRKLFSISLYYDPYSPTADQDYESLQKELSQIDVISLLNHEIKKSRIHTPTVNRIVRTLRHLHPRLVDEATMTIVSNMEAFYPCLSVVLITLSELFEMLSMRVQGSISDAICHHIRTGTHLLGSESYQAYAARILAKSPKGDVEPVLLSMFQTGKALVRREVLVALCHRNQWMMISDLKHQFPTMSQTERRAMIACSYLLGDEGKHWRNGTARSLNIFEKYIQKWFEGRPDKTMSSFI